MVDNKIESRPSLLQIKKALNELPDEKLEHFYIAHGLWLEEPRTSIDLVWMGDEKSCTDLCDMPATKVLSTLIEYLNDDAEKVSICKIDHKMIEAYEEDHP